jgi:hypothetical protein
MSTLQEIEVAILGLSEQDRLHLADKILRSLPKPPGAMVSEEILAEAIRRDQELESGVLEPLTEEAFWAGVRRGWRRKLEFHPAVRQDFIQARDYYQTKGGPHCLCSLPCRVRFSLKSLAYSVHSWLCKSQNDQQHLC